MRIETRAIAALAAVAAAAAVSAAPALADGTVFGVADDAPKHAPDGGRTFFATLHDLGMREDRVTVRWNPATPLAIPDRPQLERMLGEASAHGVAVVFALYPTRATGLAAGPTASSAFAAWAAELARAFPGVRRFIVGNEFNQPRFFKPQFLADCSPASGAAYMELLAKTYDAVKAVDPDIRIVTSVSPQGNDKCKAPSNVSRSPYRFIHDMGLAYRAMGRTRPAWDEFGLHAYPRRPVDPLSKGLSWPNISFANLWRLKQALWDAFSGTPQPTFGSAPSAFGNSLAALVPTSITIGETGWQTSAPASSQAAYFGKENVQVTSEAHQAQVYDELVHAAACDPELRSVLIFGLADEPDLDRFQAGVIRADGTRKPSYQAVKHAIADVRDGCPGPLVEWRPTQTVVGARVDFGKLKTQWWKQTWWGFTVGAEEEATYTAGIYRVPGPRLKARHRVEIGRSLAGAGSAKAVLLTSGQVRAYWSPLVRLPARRLAGGYYVYAVRLRAAMNPARTVVATSRPFRVTPKPKPKRRHRTTPAR